MNIRNSLALSQPTHSSHSTMVHPASQPQSTTSLFATDGGTLTSHALLSHRPSRKARQRPSHVPPMSLGRQFVRIRRARIITDLSTPGVLMRPDYVSSVAVCRRRASGGAGSRCFRPITDLLKPIDTALLQHQTVTERLRRLHGDTGRERQRQEGRGGDKIAENSVWHSSRRRCQ